MHGQHGAGRSGKVQVFFLVLRRDGKMKNMMQVRETGEGLKRKEWKMQRQRAD